MANSRHTTQPDGRCSLGSTKPRPRASWKIAECRHETSKSTTMSAPVQSTTNGNSRPREHRRHVRLKDRAPLDHDLDRVLDARFVVIRRRQWVLGRAHTGRSREWNSKRPRVRARSFELSHSGSLGHIARRPERRAGFEEGEIRYDWRAGSAIALGNARGCVAANFQSDLTHGYLQRIEGQRCCSTYDGTVRINGTLLRGSHTVLSRLDEGEHHG